MEGKPGPIFLFGTMLDAELREIVLGRKVDGLPAVLKDHAAEVDRTGLLASTIQSHGEDIAGLLIHHEDLGDDWERLPFYIRATGLMPEPVDVGEKAVFYRGEVGDGAWDLDAWSRSRGDLVREAARYIMSHFDQHWPRFDPPRYRQVLVHAASRLRAAAPVPAEVRRQAAPEDVVVERRTQPYAKFFSVDEADLRFRRFDGRMSEPVGRAAFVSGDAVTVLPYDPARDRVLLIEQFRAGPFARGDRNPWSLEAIAGRIDPGETPEEAGRREAVEEAGLEVGRLIEVSGFYPSPGAKSEFIYSYVGLADLPDGLAGHIGGVEDEAEDIRSHLVSFDRLMELVESGEVGNAPLIITALALARIRPGLRAAA